MTLVESGALSIFRVYQKRYNLLPGHVALLVTRPSWEHHCTAHRSPPPIITALNRSGISSTEHVYEKPGHCRPHGLLAEA